MATLTMEQDTDLKRFIEDRKQRYYDNDKAAVFATSLPLSNNGVEDRRSQLRDERHRDYQRYLERSPANSQQSSANSKQSSTKQAVYYRMDSPERGLPLGNYDLVKEKLSQERHQDYKNYLKKKHQDESERNRTRYSPSRPQVPAQPRPGDIDYSQMKQELADERKRDYQDYLGKKYIAASEHPYKQPIDYKQQRLFLAEERRHEYNEYLNKKGKAEREFALKGRVPTPPGGLDIGQYEQERKALDAARKQEYRELLDKQSQEQLLNRVWDRANETSPAHIGYRKTERPLVGSPREISLYDQRQRQKERERQNPHQKVHTPPGGLLIGGEADRLKDMAEKKRQYRDELLKQQQEHMYVRAQQENGIPVLDRTPREENSYVTSKPPPGPGAYRQRDEPTRQTPHYWDEGRPVRSPQSYDSQPGQRNDPAEHAPQLQAPQGAPPAQHSPRRTPLALQTGYRPSTPSDPRRSKPPPNLDFPYGYGYEEMRKKAIGERHKDYQEYVKRESEKYRPHADELPPPGPSDFPKGHHYNSDEYEKYRKDLQQKQHAEYQDFLQKKNQQAPDRTWKDLGDNAQGLILGDSKHENQKKLLNDERRREYNEHLAQKQMSDPPRFGRNTPPVVGPYSGIFAGLGQYDLDKQRLKKERQSEYSNYLDKTYAEKGRPYGRPTWAKDIDDSEQYPARPYSYEHRSNPETKPRDHLPPIEGQGQGNRRPPSYEDMLAKNRQKEADRRRYDPGFAPRDDRYEAERNGPARDGDYAPRDGGYGGDGNQGQDQYRY